MTAPISRVIATLASAGGLGYGDKATRVTKLASWQFLLLAAGGLAA
jgi:hypothetical protein